MMPWLVQTFALLCVLTSVHVAATALAAHCAGIPVRKVSFGTGAAIWESGKFRLGWFPISGYVRLKDSREEILSDADMADAFDHAPVWKQIAVPIAGLGSVLLITMLTLGHEGAEAFAGAFRQLVLGALSPFTDAQEYLRAGRTFAGSHSLANFAGLLGAKIVAMNLLPLGGLNGLHLLLTLIRGKQPRQWEAPLIPWTFQMMLFLFGSWLLAIAVFVGGK
ncbi:site-2 protease family protein [Pseudoduganella sp. S-14]|uniref:site-2 protease family protein n=1 Tax=Pseudoduganella sp. S-14 TaxID=3404065 RepID=UPI003CE90529